VDLLDYPSNFINLTAKVIKRLITARKKCIYNKINGKNSINMTKISLKKVGF
jgi:hypothetical protein